VDGNVLQYPQFLLDLLSNPQFSDYRAFRENIRSYNSALSFASMGAKVVDFYGLSKTISNKKAKLLITMLNNRRIIR
jgi:hypothetical protein